MNGAKITEKEKEKQTTRKQNNKILIGSEAKRRTETEKEKLRDKERMN